MSEEKEEFIKNGKAECNDYRNLLKAMLALKKFLEGEKGAKYFFGEKLKKKGKPAQTPDIIIKLRKGGLIGEGKKSLRGLLDNESKQEYIKRYIEKGIIKQIKKYDNKFDNLNISNHDLFLMAPRSDSEALGIIQIDYLEEVESPFERKFSLIVYSVEPKANTDFIQVRLRYGDISNKEVLDSLRRGINYKTGDIADEMGKYKIYEENKNSTPIQYVMLILWDSIFNEILQSSNKESIIERYKKRENKFKVRLSKLMEYLRKMYTLPTYSSGKNFSSDNERNQFKKEVVRDAMDIFCKIDLARMVSKSGKNVVYEVTKKQLPEKKELEYFLGKIYDIRKNQT